jgi:hypothetical protein
MILSNGLQQFMIKQALDVVKGGPISSWIAATLGRANPLSLPNLLMSSKAYNSPHTGDRFAKHKTTAETIDAGAEEALSDHVLRLGGTDLIDDIIWKKEHGGDSLPWYKQLGGRVLHNRRTGPLGKLIGYPNSIFNSIMTSLTRMPHYNPYSDVSVNFMDEPALTQHELGHAIDFNTLTGSRGKDEGAVSKSMLGRLGAGTLRDLYTFAYGLGPVALWHEAQANVESRKALVQAYEESDRDPKKLRKILKRRAQVLPAGYASYIGAKLPGLPRFSAIPAMLAGKGYGLMVGDSPSHIEEKMGPIMMKRFNEALKKKKKAASATGKNKP